MSTPPSSDANPDRRRPSLLIVDGSYTIDTIRRLGLEQSVLSRDLDGFFDHVWTVHPFGRLDEGGRDVGAPETTALNDRHSFIQARSGRFAWSRFSQALNFVFAQFSLVRRLSKLVRQERIAIVRVGDPLWVGMIGWIVARLGGAKFAVRINGNNDKIRETTGRAIYPRLLRSMRLERAIERFLLKRALLVAAPNQDNVDFAVAKGANPAATAIFPYGNLLAPAHRAGPGDRGDAADVLSKFGISSSRYLLCVSRLQPVKFPEDCVFCLAAARTAGHDVSLILAGEGDMREDLERVAKDLGVGDHLVLPGNVDQDRLSRLYARAAAFISPLTGRALSEAALGAAPIVAYDLDWQGDLVRTGETGILVPFRDVDALCRGVVRLLEDEGEAARMGKAARAAALAMFDPDALLANERAAYSRLLGEWLG